MVYLRQQCSKHNPHWTHGDVHVAAVTPLQGFKQLSPMEIIVNKIKSTKINVFMIVFASWLHPLPCGDLFIYGKKYRTHTCVFLIIEVGA